jgi:L-ascorbate metabolism protein UlaG (beta-lactamase superfamily)
MDPRRERMMKSKQWHSGRFGNTSGLGPSLKGTEFSLMADLLFGGRKRRPKKPITVESPVTAWSTPPESGLRVTWFGHSTLLVEIGGARILIDPVFGDYASPGWYAGRKRFHPVPATLAELPELDAIILSHDHYDHLCTPTWRQLARATTPVVTSLGVGERIERLGVEASRVTELDWWEQHTLPGGVTITATPAQHFSGRGLSDRNTTLWSSWVLSSADHRVFYSGDTGLTQELAEIGKRYGPFDLSMIEIGASHPAWEAIHLGPANAVRALEMLGGGPMLPIHWATFDLALHTWEEPAETLLDLTREGRFRVFTPPVGRAFEPASAEVFGAWWR